MECWGFLVMQRHEDSAIVKPQTYSFQGKQASEKAEILILCHSTTWNNSCLPTAEVQRCQHLVFEIKSWGCFLASWKKMAKVPGFSSYLLDLKSTLHVPTFKSLMRVSRCLICSSVWLLAWTFCSWDLISRSSSAIVLRSFSSVMTQLSQAVGKESSTYYWYLVQIQCKHFDACHLVPSEEQWQQQYSAESEISRKPHLHLASWPPLL